MRDEHGLLTEADAARTLALMNRNDVRAAATSLFGCAGADFDGNNLSVMRNRKWTVLHRDMCRALERYMSQ